MNYWVRLLLFFSVATSVWAVAHWYVSKRLIEPWHANYRAKKRARRILWATFFLAPAVMFLGRSLANVEWFAPIRWAGFVQMGLFFLLFMFLVFRDLGMLLAEGVRRILRRPVDPERRRFFENASNAGILGLTSALGGSGLASALSTPEVVEVDVPITNLPPALDGYRIVQLSDIHVGPTIKGKELREMVSVANALEPDMVAVTGDLVDGYVEDMRDDVAPLGDLRGRDGVFFCTGNHEYYWDADAWVAEVRRLGLTALLNEHVVVERDGAKVLVAGCLDYSSHRVVPEAISDPAGAKADAAPHDLSILLAHQPKSIKAAAEAGYDLQLSGHTHGGQFFPVTLFVGLVHPFSQGLGKQDNTWIYVNRGTGYWGPPLRAGVPPEITLLRLVRA
ncbi:MAG: metallophosphoesterase [Myxococcota bacterium]